MTILEVINSSKRCHKAASFSLWELVCFVALLLVELSTSRMSKSITGSFSLVCLRLATGCGVDSIFHFSFSFVNFGVFMFAGCGVDVWTVVRL